MKFQNLLIVLLAACSLLAGCGGVSRPSILACIVNAPARNRKCYNLATDYNDDGSLKATAKPVIRPNTTIDDVNKAFTVDSADPSPTGFVDALAGLKTYLNQLRKHYANCEAGN